MQQKQAVLAFTSFILFLLFFCFFHALCSQGGNVAVAIEIALDAIVAFVCVCGMCAEWLSRC